MSARKLFWIDLEMTGLDPAKDKILELACLITDKQLNVIDEGFEEVIHQDDEVIDLMGDVVSEMHKKSGLTERARESKVSEEEAYDKLLTYVREHLRQHEGLFSGNSIGIDKSFIEAYFPKVATHMHYRVVDVTTIKELALDWYPDLSEYKKKENHRALDDIKESIEELKYYRVNIFKWQ